MIYVIIAAILTVFSAGFYTGHELNNAKVLATENALVKQNSDALVQLTNAENRVISAKNEALLNNQNLDKAHVSAIETANNYHDLLASAKLRVPVGRKSCANTVSIGTDTKVADEETGYIELPESTDRFFKSETYRGDTVNAYADACYTFVVEQNCGIKK